VTHEDHRVPAVPGRLPRDPRNTRRPSRAAWQEAPFFTARERAALAWCDALTELPRTGALDEVFAVVAAVFSPEKIASLTFAIVSISSWNQLAAGLGAEVTSLGGLHPRGDSGAPLVG
jgi:alkylhydroperoxidase family enzyme